jgi:hypothetical protein
MPNLRDYFRRFSPHDPRDLPRNILIAVCAVAVAGLIIALMVTGHGG